MKPQTCIICKKTYTNINEVTPLEFDDPSDCKCWWCYDDEAGRKA